MTTDLLFQMVFVKKMLISQQNGFLNCAAVNKLIQAKEIPEQVYFKLTLFSL